MQRFMAFMYKYLFVLSLISLASCIKNDPFTHSKSEVTSEILLKAATTLKKEKELYVCGSGGQMMDQVKMLALSFFYYKDIELEEGRELVTYAVNELVNTVNSNGEVRPFLANYPFQAENVEIRIFLQYPDGSSFGANRLSVITALNGDIQYKTEKGAGEKFEIAYRETFGEAMQKLEKQKAI